MRHSIAQPSLFIPHGGGPCFFMDWNMGPPDTWDAMAAWLRGLARTLPAQPRAVVVISAHWEDDAFSVTSNPNPPLLYDYYGFPAHTYRLIYPAPGDPVLAQRIVALLAASGLPARDDDARGFDHGVFIPFMLIFPGANIPIVQLSLHASLDAELHLRAGRALAPLREEGVLIVGSGMSYHNMRGFGDPRSKPDSVLFDNWLNEILRCPGAAGPLAKWETAPAARAVHPREEHLIPLMVAYGAGGGAPGTPVFTGQPLGVSVSAFRFGAGATDQRTPS